MLPTQEVLILADQESSRKKKSSVWVYESRLPGGLCDLIVEEFKKVEALEAAVGAEKTVCKEIRNVVTAEVNRGHWVNGIPMYFGFDSNFDNFHYQVSDVAFTEFFTYTKGMFYKPHVDISPYPDDPSHTRKLTVITQLSSPDDYEGGELQIFSTDLTPVPMTKQKGSIIIFNSSTPHQVTPVTSGTRYVLASWIVGPPFS